MKAIEDVMQRVNLLALLFVGVGLLAGLARAADPVPPRAAAEEPKFIRLRKTDDNRPAAMETAVVHYKAAGRPGVELDLVGAVHIGDKTYYDELNKLFATYDV